MASGQMPWFDVKVGNGAFMGNPEDARNWPRPWWTSAKTWLANRGGVCHGPASGPAVAQRPEVKEAIAVLRGEGPEDLRELCLELGSRMLVLGGGAKNLAEGRQRLEQVLASGAALDKLRELVANQGGDAGLVDQPQLLPTAQIQQEVAAPRTGWITEMDTAGIGNAAQILGAGRSKKGESIDLAVGLEILAKTGDHVEAGQPLAILHAISGCSRCHAKSLLAILSAKKKSHCP